MSLAGRISPRHIDSPLVWPGRVEARLYQQTIAEKATSRNTLVVLPTALGKTVISVLATAHFLYNFKHMRILVMAPTRPLVLQHRETYIHILKLTEEDAVTLTGKTPALYRKQIWDGKARIIFATPQVVRNDLESGLLTLKDFSLLVAGRSTGLLLEDLIEDAIERGITPSIAKAAVERLEETGQIGKIGWDRIVPVASVPTVEKMAAPGRDEYEVMVEKIYRGSAVVLINDKWRARMTPQDFEGPTGMIKKDARCRAVGTLYRDGNTLCFRVRQVTRIPS